MKLASWNVNGLRVARKKGFLDFVAAEQPDVLCVQETKLQADQLSDDMRAPAGYRSYGRAAERKGDSGSGRGCGPRRSCLMSGAPTTARSPSRWTEEERGFA